MKPEVAYVELTLPEVTKEYLKSILGQIVNEDQFYASPVIPHINGDVTSRAHLTFFYGLEPEQVENQELKELLGSWTSREIHLGDFMIMNGYQGLYRILSIKVLDDDRSLNAFVNKIRKFSNRPNSYEFKPHITLAYVSADYSLPITQPVLKESILGEELRVLV